MQVAQVVHGFYETAHGYVKSGNAKWQVSYILFPPVQQTFDALLYAVMITWNKSKRFCLIIDCLLQIANNEVDVNEIWNIFSPSPVLPNHSISNR